MRISVIGLGKLGAPLAAVLADKGFDVVGVDLNPHFVEALAAGHAPVSEPGLQDRIDRARSRLAATTDIADAVGRTDVTFVIVPTPSGGDGMFSNDNVIAAARTIGAALRRKTNYHLVTITSTVMPGSTGGPIRAAIEQASGRRLGERIGLCYSPEFIALGSVVQDMLNPDFVLIGELDRRSGDVLAGIYRAVCDNRPPVERMSLVNAELTKIALNTYVTMKISFTNMLAGICDRIPGADASVIAAALGQDSRVGGKYLSPGLGYGGPCFPRDNVALSALARDLNTHADLALATDRINSLQPGRIAALVQRSLASGTIGILGLSYKPSTSVIEQSQSVEIAVLLADAGYRVRVFDPQALQPAMAVLGKKVEAAADANDCAKGADLLIVATPWRSFLELQHDALSRTGGRRLPVIDCWHLLPPTEFGSVVDLIYPGQGIAASRGDADLRRRLG